MTRHDRDRRTLLTEGWLLHAAGFAVTVGLAVVVGAVILQPVHSQNQQIAAENASLDQLLKSAPEIRDASQELRRKIAQAEEHNVRLAARVPRTPHEADFLGQMTALAHQVELDIHDYRPGVIRLLENHGEMEVQFNAQGTYESICRFLRRTEELPRLCQISRLEIKAPATGDKTHIDVTLLIFFVQEDRSNASAGGAPRG